MKNLAILMLYLVLAGCDTKMAQNSKLESTTKPETLVEAKKGFKTKIIRSEKPGDAPDTPDRGLFDLVKYKSSVGQLAAYVTKDPKDGKKHPAIVWITGGDNNSIGDIWSKRPRSNDQSVSAFRKAGIIMMFPSQRGGNDNPGKREGFYGEVDDILDATEYLASLPYVDEKNIYLGGHSTGGTLAMLVGASSNRFRAIISLGPVASPIQYGNEFLYCDPNDEEEIELRSPIYWLHCINSPMYVIEGEEEGNWEVAEYMSENNTNEKVKFFKVPKHDHFTVIAPVVEELAGQIANGHLKVTQQTIDVLK